MHEGVESDRMNAVRNFYLELAKVRRVLSKSVKCAIAHTASCLKQNCIGCDGEKSESKKCEDVSN